MAGALTGITILMIGASHMASPGYLISTLGDRLAAEGAVVQTYGACGAPPEAWITPAVTDCGTAHGSGAGPVVLDRKRTARSWSVDELIAIIHPNLVLVGIGDSLASYPQPQFPREWVVGEVRTLAARIAHDGVACLWLGPGWGNERGPYFKTFARVKLLSDLLATSVAPCGYIDSLALSKRDEWPTFDGQHYTAAGCQS